MSNLTFLLQTALVGAEAQNLSDAQVSELVRDLIEIDDRELTTRQAARELGRAEVTLKKWRSTGKGPRYRKDEHGRVAYRLGWIREYQNQGLVS